MTKSVLKTPSSKQLAGGNTIQPATATQSGEAAESSSGETGLTTHKVKIILRFHLRNLSTNNTLVTDETIFKDTLSDLDIAGISSRTLFKALSRRDIVRNGGHDKKWPESWIDENISSLAPKISG
ncbi:hypothetical protein [uncultured Sphaerotilus sp.]|uniref:hypothetical protein n=1 Tax=uncultured Sphaerotilus sp. TaxID=474984 RepID=UPI0030CA4712